MNDIGILRDELLDPRSVLDRERQGGAVHRVGECPGQHQLTAVGVLAHQSQVCLALGRSPLKDVVNVVVEEQENTSLRDLAIAEAVDRVIVHHADRLHERVADRRPYKLESPAQEVSTQGLGLRCPRGDLPERSPAIHARCPADKTPHIRIETPELALDGKKGVRVAYRTADLERVANDPRILLQARNLRRPERRHHLRVKPGECLAIRVALLENRLPAQSPCWLLAPSTRTIRASASGLSVSAD